MDNRRRRERFMINLLIIRVMVNMEILRQRGLRARPAAQPLQAAPQRRRAVRHANVQRTRLSPLGMSAHDIFTTYRFDMASILYILDEISVDISPIDPRYNSIPPLVKLLSVLHFCATGSFQHTSSLVHGIAQQTFSAILNLVLAAMLKRVNLHIRMPRTTMEMDAKKAGLFALARFPNVIGCIDCTHIGLVPPSAHEQAYRNRKMTHTMNVQMVCDANLCFLQVCARFPGSAHDARILRESTLFNFMEQRTPPRTVLLGDSGYPLLPWLLTPYRNPQTPAQEKFNRAHISTRNCIERAFGLLKSRFRCLDRSGGALMYKPEKVGRIVVLCAMLHNIAVRRRVPEPDPPADGGGGDCNNFNQRAVPADAIEGRAVRDTITARYFS